jgi:rfaE bifunctional protein kinase chain/domain
VNRAAAERLLARAREGRVLVLGDAILDEYVLGGASRLSPEAPVPVVEVAEVSHFPGGAANVVLNVTALGGSATLVAVVGDDAEAQRLEERLASEPRLSLALLSDPARPTTKKTRVVAHGQQIVRFDRESRRPVEGALALRLLREVEAFAAEGPGVLVLSDYAKGVLSDEVLAGAFAVAARHALPVVVDPKRRRFEAYRGATVLTPNASEARAALEAPAETPTEALLGPLLEALAGAALLVTEGERGMTLARAGASPVRIPARGRAVFDRTGAGDTVVATLAALLAGGAELEEAAVLANVAAGVVVGKRGVATVGADEVLAELD